MNLSEVEPRRGQVDVHEWYDDDGRRHILVLAGLRPYPFTEFSDRRKKQGLSYAAWQSMTRDHLKAALRVSGTRPYPNDAILGLAMAFGASPERNLPGQPQHTSVLSWDLRNLEKALEDACKFALWHDDKQVRYAGPGSAIDDTKDWWSLHVWDGGSPWREEWTAFSVPIFEVVPATVAGARWPTATPGVPAATPSSPATSASPPRAGCSP